jgi:hypothetical protein
MYRGISLFRATAGALLAVLALASRSVANSDGTTGISGSPSPGHIAINVSYSISVSAVYAGKWIQLIGLNSRAGTSGTWQLKVHWSISQYDSAARTAPNCVNQANGSYYWQGFTKYSDDPSSQIPYFDYTEIPYGPYITP